MNSEEKTKKGWLHKQGGSSKGWKRRYCVFENNALFYYKSEKDVEYAGVIYAEDMRQITYSEDESKKKKEYAFCFEIETQERKWMFCSDTKEEMDEWMAFISSVWEDTEEPDVDNVQQFATVEVYASHGLRVNGAVEAGILAKMSEGATAKQKRKDARGWFCEKYVSNVSVLSMMSEYGWKCTMTYKTQSVTADNKMASATMMIFSRPLRNKK
eukprot:Lithocolla_globosa_v1_NODE_8668_length_794_cov_44.515562.p1 type:complete len:213 gc:universal NODE_8668_length_794_cov_44.515562:728-90(-)